LWFIEETASRWRFVREDETRRTAATPALGDTPLFRRNWRSWTRQLGCLTAIAEDRANVVLTMLKWSCVDTTVVRCGCSSRVGREFRFQPLLPYVSRKLKTMLACGVHAPRERSLTQLRLSR